MSDLWLYCGSEACAVFRISSQLLTNSCTQGKDKTFALVVKWLKIQHRPRTWLVPDSGILSYNMSPWEDFLFQYLKKKLYICMYIRKIYVCKNYIPVVNKRFCFLSKTQKESLNIEQKWSVVHCNNLDRIACWFPCLPTHFFSVFPTSFSILCVRVSVSFQFELGTLWETLYSASSLLSL